MFTQLVVAKSELTHTQFGLRIQLSLMCYYINTLILEVTWKIDDVIYTTFFFLSKYLLNTYYVSSISQGTCGTHNLVNGWPYSRRAII